MRTKSDEPAVGSVIHAIAILRHLGEVSTERRGVNAIARSLTISPSSCFNLLKTLVREELVEFDPVGKVYSLGAGLGLLAEKALGPHNAFPLVAPLFEELAEEFTVTASLWRVIPMERMVLIGVADNTSQIRIHMTVGQRLPYLIGAAGRCVAAMMDIAPDVLATKFVELRWANPPSFAEYQYDVMEAHARGWARDIGNYRHGVTTISAGVSSSERKPLYLVSATTFQYQHDRLAIEALGERLRKTADAVGSILQARFAKFEERTLG